MKAVDRILQTIKTNGAVTAKQLSEALGMTTMGARQHLQGLENEGILEFHDIKAKVGRPTRHWSLTAKGHAQFSDKHGELTIQMIDAIEQVFGHDGLQKVVEERELQTFIQYKQALESSHSLEDKLDKLVQLREQEGYMAELNVTEQGFQLIENHCPICHAANRCPRLCQSELNIFQKLLGSETLITRSEHIIQGQRRCTYNIKQAS
ncbi:transcriptional regulator [Vibrio sp. S4M6]|uniref:helix-turn-helix transcriptional regulator n=1 Tax=Vibrio sinus TaxID=2946865 RepID=UPI002029B89F|nr:metalloregulator ArsR/SmtB family transcription factor [Vibrio sinus]MCL9780379.1 transcriptional regulator [Vibrio sinus]